MDERGDSIMNWIENILAEGEHATRLRNDLEYFAQHCLKLALSLAHWSHLSSMRHSANYTNYLKGRRQALDESASSSSRRASLASQPMSPPAFISEQSIILACAPLSSATRGVPARTSLRL